MSSKRCIVLLSCILVFLVISKLFNQSSSTFQTWENKSSREGSKQQFFYIKQDVVYIKVEKAASSSFARIFKSFGLRNHLRMILPLTKSKLVNTRELQPGLSWDFAPDRGTPNIAVNHQRYSRPFFDKYFPNDTVYVSSIRHPVKWFISYVDYMSTYRHNTPRQVLHDGTLFYKTKNWIAQLDRHVHNNFLQWLGFRIEHDFRYNEAEVVEYIEFIERKFSLIMIADHFFESVVLLRRLMNWSMKDIFFGHTNSARKKSNTILNRTEITKLLDANHNRGDWLLFQHFNATLWTKIAKEDHFYEELDVFKQLNKQVVEFCNSKKLKRDKTKVLHLSTQWENRIRIDDERCIAIRTPLPGEGKEFDELHISLNNYAKFPEMTRTSDLELGKYEKVPWPQ